MPARYHNRTQPRIYKLILAAKPFFLCYAGIGIGIGIRYRVRVEVHLEPCEKGESFASCKKEKA